MFYFKRPMSVDPLKSHLTSSKSVFTSVVFVGEEEEILVTVY